MNRSPLITDTLTLARAVSARVKEAGGRAYLVGGYVRDVLLGQKSKDIDLEVYGLAPARLKELLCEFGEPYTRGAAFGVFGLMHSDIDIAMPRKEKAVGGGHKDFDVTVDPFLPVEQACRRRDFTVNALLLDPLTGEVTDCVGGRADLSKRVLRHVCADSFPEDPLRVYRAARFSAVLGFSIAEETVALCRGIETGTLSRERVMEETARALMKSERPSVYFTCLRSMGQLHSFFPELEALIGAGQNPQYHPEGDVFTHTMAVLDAGARLKDTATEPLFFMLSCLMHDLGKPASAVTAPDGTISCPEHGPLGVPVAERALERLTNDKKLTAYVLNMVRYHMAPLFLYRKNAPVSETRRLLDLSVAPEDLLILTKADGLGKGSPQPPEKERFWEARYADYREFLRFPRVTGADLIAAGIAPGTGMGRLLDETYEWALQGIPREEALARALALHDRETNK